ncbi:MAG: hypothetical protein NZ959_05465 [Armatimonadetes bacterium]|nr:hypothetical protein [Armatimonadota bacterium]MDW8122072.1 hypothetical protein [Armatimonadota bacterium]
MRKALPVTVSVALFLVLTAVATQNTEGHLLRYKFLTDVAFLYENTFTINMTVNLPLPNQDVTMNMDMEGQTREWQRAEEVDKDGIATILMTTTGKMKMTMTGLPTPGQPELSMDIPRTRMKLRIDPRGRVLQMEILEMDETLKEKMPFSPGDISFGGGAGGMGYQGILFPENPAKEGDDWDATQTINFSIKDRSVRYEVKGRARLIGLEKVAGRDCVVIENTYEMVQLGDMIRQITEAVAPPGGAQLTVDGSVKGTNKFWFDNNAGHEVRSEGSADMEMSMTIQAQGQPSITMTMKGSAQGTKRLSKILKKKE